MENGEILKIGKFKIISILVCLMLTVATMTVGVFAASNARFKKFATSGVVNFATKNIEGEVIGSVSGYGLITGNSTYNGSFRAGDDKTTFKDGEEIGNSLKSWEMGDIHFTTNQNEPVDIEITITIKNRGDRGIVLNYLAPSTPSNITLSYKQAVTNTLNVTDDDWQGSLQARDIGKIIEFDEHGNRITQNSNEFLVIQKNEYYTFKMIISITNDADALPEEGVSLNFSFEMNAG